MINPYRMVLVNVILFSGLIITLLIYRFIYPRKKINLFILLIIISFLPLVSLLRAGAYESGDFNLHIYRAMAFYDSLKEMNFQPSWAGALNASYGYPLFIFLNPLPYLIISFFHFIGFSFIASTKLFLAFSYIFSGIGIYLFAQKIFKKALPAFAVGIVYLFTPYHLVDLHFRIAVGEILFFAIFPFLLLSIYNLFANQNLKNTLTSSLLLAFLFMAHQAVALFSMILITSYVLFLLFQNKKNAKKKLIYSTSSLILGLIMSMYVWIPHLIYTQYTISEFVTKNGIIFQSIWEYIYSKWRFGFLFQGPKGELSFLLGYTQLAIFVSSIYLIFKTRVAKLLYKQFVFWTILLLLFLFLLLPISNFIWNLIPYLTIAQFSYRLLIFITLIVSVLAGFVVVFLKKSKLIYLFIFLTILYTILNWGQRRVIPEISDATLRENIGKSTFQGEGLTFLGSPKWIDIKKPWIENTPKTHLEFIKGEGQILEIKRSTIYHQYLINAKTDSILKENTYYFPGWHVKINGEEVSINKSLKKYPGIITFKISAGKQKIDVFYLDFLIFRIVKIISALGIISSMGILIALSIFKKKHV